MKLTKTLSILLWSLVIIGGGTFRCSAQAAEHQPADSLQTTAVRDSLLYKRGVFFGRVYRKNAALDLKTLKALFKDNAAAARKHRLGSYVKPLGALVSVGGLGLSYIAIKGKPASVVVEGKTYDYAIRSLPKLLAGIGGFVGGICLMEFGHELQGSAVDVYNAGLGKKRVSLLKNASLGITPSGNIGLFAKF